MSAAQTVAQQEQEERPARTKTHLPLPREFVERFLQDELSQIRSTPDGKVALVDVVALNSGSLLARESGRESERV